MAPTQELTRYICLFHDEKRARSAVRALEDAGFQGVNTLGNDAYSTGKTGSQTLADLHVPDRDLEHLQDGLRRGGVVVSLEAPESRSREIERIFHHHSADKIDETDLENTATAAGGAPFSAAPVAGAESTAVAADAVIPVAEESLAVGKRDVERGGVRVYRRTVEEPVREDVNLHGERVVLEYRETNRPATDADLRAGSQQIELVETTEVPVVQKVARVVEEIHVGKVETERTEVVEDTVRHTEVQVEPVEGDTSRGPVTRR